VVTLLRAALLRGVAGFANGATGHGQNQNQTEEFFHCFSRVVAAKRTLCAGIPAIAAMSVCKFLTQPCAGSFDQNVDCPGRKSVLPSMPLRQYSRFEAWV
jgi:hypothetical protein